MKHFTIWQWVDFARGVGDKSERTNMEAHLGSGCSRCARLVGTLGRVTAIAHAEAHTAPPDGAIRYAKALFSLHQSEKSGLGRLIARLIHDSSLAPLPAGMRAEARSTRHLLYEAGRFLELLYRLLELLVEYLTVGNDDDAVKNELVILAEEIR